MSKSITFLVIALLLFVSLTQAARPDPAIQRETQLKGVEEVNPNKVDEGCDGVGEEECLARRTLTAHTDYIYTQEDKN